jgi:glycerol-3-phosphate acyltransferase PlsY
MGVKMCVLCGRFNCPWGLVHKGSSTVMHPILLGIVAFFIGSFPTAYVLLRRSTGGDIRALGSGNVGARNLYEITGNRIFGVAVGIIDVGKGIAAALVWHAFGNGSAAAFSACLAGAILGHVFSPWIGFRGGRGLATGAGILLVTVPAVLFGWGVAWLIGMRSSHDLIRSNMIASAIAVLIVCFMPSFFIETSIAPFDSLSVARAGIAGALVVVGLAHFRGVKQAR